MAGWSKANTALSNLPALREGPATPCHLTGVRCWRHLRDQRRSPAKEMNKEINMKALLAAALVALCVASAHAASCNLPSSSSATSASYSGRFFDADGSVAKVGKCVLTGVTRNGDTAATFQFDNTCGPLVVVTTTGFATRLTKKGSQLAECSGWDIDSGGNTTILSVIQTDSTTAARKGEKDVSTFGSSGKVFVGKLTAKY